MRLLDAEARRRGVVVACMSDPALPLVTVDEAQVKQVLMNVILNAIEACAARGRVEITTRTDESGEESSCVVAVADSKDTMQRTFVCCVDQLDATEAVASTARWSGDSP